MPLRCPFPTAAVAAHHVRAAVRVARHVTQDQPLDEVDFGALAQRLAQNGVQEKLTAPWIDRCLDQLPPPAERKAA